MKIRLHNSLTKSVDEFYTMSPKLAKIYSCGPTVYSNAHIGNMRAFLFADLLQRVLKVVGEYKVQWVMNITDIDDKTIRDAQPESGKWIAEMGEQSESDIMFNLKRLTQFYTKEFLKDIESLGIRKADFFSMPRATDYIDNMQELIKLIYENGYAYISDGSVYFDVAKWKDHDKYGKLFKIDFDNFRKGERVDSDEYERENVSDFVLWKAFKEGEPFWEYHLGGKDLPGRPGWHIECSTMSKVLFRDLPFDIHTGGIDLKFPHHEDEIAQSKAGYGKEPANFWCHNEFLEVEGEKMSKSAGNFLTLRDLVEKGIDTINVRFAMLSVHYASKYNFTFSGVEAAQKARVRIQDYIYSLFEIHGGEKSADVQAFRESVFTELANDLHTPKALGKVFTFINSNDPENLNEKSKDELKSFFHELNDIFSAWVIEPKDEELPIIPEEVKDLAEQRWKAKTDKNWAEADRLRDLLTSKGYTIKDTKDSYDIIKN